MKPNETRQQAIGITKNLAELIYMAAGKELDFYQLLWVIHWAIENHGLPQTRKVVEEVMLAPEFKPENMALALRDALIEHRVKEDRLGEWFQKAMTA